MTRPTLGVMVLYMNQKKQIEELRYFRQLLVAGERLGLNMLLFTPEDVNEKNNQVHAFLYDRKKNKWTRTWTAIPRMIFDRCRYQRTRRFQKLKQFRARYPHLLYLNRPLANKWIIYQYLAEKSAIRPYLPHTRLVENTRQLSSFLQRYPVCFLKPVNGTGGRGILKVSRLSRDLYRVEGRNRYRKIISPRRMSAKALKIWLQTWQKGLPYIMQQGIDLDLEGGRVHDYRQLIQKNRQGKWEITGCAGRIGARRSVTSNLHGGGRAVRMDVLLQKRFDAKKAEAVKDNMNQLGFAVVAELEKKYKQMCEMALDIAVDRKGHPWLLEINPKPSREIFNRIGEKETYRTAIVRPLQYALWMHEQARK